MGKKRVTPTSGKPDLAKAKSKQRQARALLNYVKLLNGFGNLMPSEQKRRMAKVERALKVLEERREDAAATLNTVAQLRQISAHMLTASGQLEQSLRINARLVSEYEESISEFHGRAAFQLADLAIHSFRRRHDAAGTAYCLSALEHAAQAGKVSWPLIEALQWLRKDQEKRASTLGPPIPGPKVRVGPARRKANDGPRSKNKLA